MRKYRTAGLVFVLTVVLMCTACGKKKEENTAKPTGNALKVIQSSGELRVGTEGTYSPFTFHDQAGTLMGFDVDIAKEVAKRLNVKATFVETKWDGMLAGLDAKRFDMVANEVSIRDDRKVKYDFSDPYIVSKSVLIVREDNTDIKKLADLKGKKSGQSLTSNLSDIAKANGATIVQVDGFNQAIDLLASKRIDATINDGLSYLDLKKQRPDTAIKVVDETDVASQSGFLFPKGSEALITAVNKALKDMKADGTYLGISQKYFGADVSK
ncbi:amino acid ABC transporter substrate-binding protein [Paenibacillus baekrokdamisoli]|uniref:Amino acid ABC transporter substrate-binding protein n=1 Tax=Paenibacillus baekrokdamisoli TaxID=1712516 RepID=A0A3G9JFE4_9BACL|nr:amino acid ABC transporter substrate-binding protein [Paenibacillus baekrokdamisoli]MBB3068866.1 cystine transport system substrate-binding protein [Paenibacillus baekrokdamisoli]BBH23693.1 amino acid ABC transporter substrate-binding protein [Paenibacillus baekrokdamisoli]